MNKFYSKQFHGVGLKLEGVDAQVAAWLNSLVSPGVGVTVISMSALAEGVIVIAKCWPLADLKKIADGRPLAQDEEPSIE